MAFLSQILLVFLCFHILIHPSAQTSSYHTSLVYKNCTTKTFTGGKKSHSQSLSFFFQVLTSQSSRHKFYKTTTGDEDTGISGLFQCRGDLSNNECRDCISKLPEVSNSLCLNAASARIQLHGCYVHYATDEFSDVGSSKHELLHKICGEQKAVFSGFEEVRDAAFAAMESGIAGGIRYFAGDYELMHMAAQCEEDLERCDCGECVNIAVQIAQEECGESLSGEIYLDKCYISYNYYPDGIPGTTNSGSGGGGNTGKSVAIVLGGVAALGLVFLFLLFIRKLGKKDDDC
ncbi:hypothetical protein SLEP1_g16995 [Rubroshorea leprosula]|uniref:Gnk2-homologous domain-containing protein n=1 Tax=Rubroshorea leprosula TaxID=152421 RepID=A0AAV5IYL4_9ROSI|nr:hypothetical protein SLEP1_g16995 [Rubroshorea leprosula]